MNGKLILVEGLPGSGKSSTSQFICDQLQRSGHKARWYYEDETPHPVAATRGLRNADDFQEYSRVARRGWRSFAQRVTRGREIAIIESHFFQDAISPLLLEDVDPGLIVAHVRAIAKICMPLDPVLVYLYQPDYGQIMRRICDQRGPRIEQLYIVGKERSAYGQRHHLTGFEGLVKFWLDIRAIMERLFQQLDLPKLAIDNTAQRWADHYRQVCDYLSLSLKTDDSLSREEYLRQYTGVYTYKRQGAPRRIGGELVLSVGDWARRVGGIPRQLPQHYFGDVEFAIRLEGGELVMHDYYTLWPTNRLIPKEEDVFHVASFPFTMVFERDDAGDIAGATRVNPFGKWLVTGQKYPRISAE